MHRVLVTTVLLTLPACLPSTAGYLSVPLRSEDGADHAGVRVRVPFAEIAARLDNFTPASVAFYQTGRAPLPHRLIDTDGDGVADAAEVEVTARGDGGSVLTIVCPGPRADDPLPAGADPTPAVSADFEQARR